MEEEGRDYYFLSTENFKSKIDQGAFYEWEEVYSNHYYGTLKTEVDRIWDGGKHVIFDIDVVGGLNLKKIFGDSALAIFVSVENINILRERLSSRKTENDSTLQMRMDKAESEMSRSNEFDYVLINNDLDNAVAEAKGLIEKFLGI